MSARVMLSVRSGFPSGTTDPSSEGKRIVPFRALAAGCGGFLSNVYTAPLECHAEPTMVGLMMFRRPDSRRAVWRAFACGRHAGQLLAARPLLPRDRDILQRRRDARRTELAGHRWAGEREGPLARGAQADRLVECALAWAASRAASPDR